VNVHKKPYEGIGGDEALARRIVALLPVDRRLYAYANQRLDGAVARLNSRLLTAGTGQAMAGDTVGKRVAKLRAASAALGAECQPPIDDHVRARVRRDRKRRRLEGPVVEGVGDEDAGGEERGTRRQRLLDAPGRPMEQHRARLQEAAARERRKEYAAAQLTSGSNRTASLASSHEMPPRPAPLASADSASLGVEDEDEGTPPLSARCWRHGADQRAYSNHLKALAGLKCSSRKYKQPVDFDHLPLEIRRSDAACHAG
jgi:hypothetical protein